MPEPLERPLITTPSELSHLIARIRAIGQFAFDTEFVSEETFEPVLCLIQIATVDEIVAVDPIAVRDVGPFWDLVNDPEVDVIMHAAGEDLRICRLQTGRVPARLFDVQIAAGLVGYGYPLSLANLVSQVLGHSVFGGETRTDWRKRPLSEAQLRYALDDVRHLLPLASALRARLVALDRLDWAEAEMRDFLDGILNRDDESRWRKLSGLHHLNRRGLEVARRLSRWRHDEAKRINRPIRQVMRDDLLVAISKRQPTTRPDLEALRDFNRPHLLGKSQELLAAIAEAQTVPTEQLPEHLDRHDDGPGLTMLVSVLAAALATCCAESKVAVGLVGTSNDLKELIRWQSQGRPAAESPFLAAGWRDKVCGATLLNVLSGRSTLRVGRIDSDVPVVVEPRPGPGLSLD